MIRQAFRSLLVNRGLGQVQLVKESTLAAAAKKDNWDLYAGVLVERLPIITKPLNDLEKDFQKLLTQIEFENSLKSDFEIQHEKDVRLAEMIKREEIEMDLDAVSKQTAQDLKDAWKDEVSKFQLASRTTKADTENDITSVKRKLADTLVLLAEQKLGKDKLFLLPQGKRLANETLRQTAERVLQETCGKSLNVRFYGNAPIGFYKYKYPKGQRSETSVGAKVFFFRATYQNGAADQKLAKVEWLDKDGALNKLSKFEKYCKSVKPLLL